LDLKKSTTNFQKIWSGLPKSLVKLYCNKKDNRAQKGLYPYRPFLIK